MSKLIVAVDIDDVILAEAAFIVEYSNRYWGHTLTADDYQEDWAAMWGIDDDAELRRRIDALHAPGVQVSYDMINGVEPTLKWLANQYRLVVLTSRRGVIKQETLDWIEMHLPGIFSDCYFTGFWDSGKKGGNLLTKGELAKDIGASYLIDDQPKHCISAAKSGVQAVLFGDYGLNRAVEIPAGVVRCKDWAAVQEYFDARKD